MNLMTWFGESWGAPVNAELEQVETPVGRLCVWCDEEIDEDDRGVIYGNGPPAHVECFLRQTIGGVNHIEGACTCCGGILDPDPPGLTKREAARAAIGAWERKHGGRVL